MIVIICPYKNPTVLFLYNFLSVQLDGRLRSTCPSPPYPGPSHSQLLHYISQPKNPVRMVIGDGFVATRSWAHHKRGPNSQTVLLGMVFSHRGGLLTPMC